MWPSARRRATGCGRNQGAPPAAAPVTNATEPNPADACRVPRMAGEQRPACRWTGLRANSRCPMGRRGAPSHAAVRRSLPARMRPSGKPIGGEAWAADAADAGRDRHRRRRGLCRLALLLPCARRPDQRTSSTPAPRSRRDHIRLAKPEAADPVRRCPGAALLGRAAGPRARPRSSDRRGPYDSNLPSALAAAAAVGQGAGLARPVVADERGVIDAVGDCSSVQALLGRPGRWRRMTDPLAPLEPATPTEQPATTEPPATKPSARAARRRRRHRPSHSQGLARRVRWRSATANGKRARLGIDALPNGPLKPYAKAELYTAKGSPKVELAPILALLAEAPELPQAEQLAAHGDEPAARSSRPRSTGRARPSRWAARRAAARPARSRASPPLTSCGWRSSRWSRSTTGQAPRRCS